MQVRKPEQYYTKLEVSYDVKSPVAQKVSYYALAQEN